MRKYELSKIFSIILFLSTFVQQINAQNEAPEFTVKASRDTVYMGNAVKITFTIANAQKKQFVAPEFEDFEEVGSGNQSSSYSIINGVVNQSSSFSYYLEPKKEGTLYIEPAFLDTGDDKLETPKIPIVVVPNPEGIEQDPNGDEYENENINPFKNLWNNPLLQEQQPPKKSAPKKQEDDIKTIRI